jgi:hypothetical protein
LTNPLRTPLRTLQERKINVRDDDDDYIVTTMMIIGAAPAAGQGEEGEEEAQGNAGQVGQD